MRVFYLLIIVFILFGSMRFQREDNCYMNNYILNFLESKKYTYSQKKSDIPKVVLDRIGNLNHEYFKIGDSADIGKISFSDASLGGYEYKRKLHFTLLNDTFCLIAFTEGGIGTHDVIYFIQYKGAFRHIKYVTTKILSDTIKLKKYLKSYPKFAKNKK